LLSRGHGGDPLHVAAQVKEDDLVIVSDPNGVTIGSVKSPSTIEPAADHNGFVERRRGSVLMPRIKLRHDLANNRELLGMAHQWATAYQIEIAA
jgi:hypothetical protein